jgi:calcium/calmodulin-dependent protein kinase I
MHEKGICHRDLKPNNILCSEDGNTVKITDFNVSKFSPDNFKAVCASNSDPIKMWTYTGTVAFSAPEMFEGGEYTESVDIWSAGVVL